jgi:hypothetical protein
MQSPSATLVLLAGRFGEDGKVSIVGEEIFVAVLMAAYLGSAGEAFRAEVKVRAVGTAHTQSVDLILNITYTGTGT